MPASVAEGAAYHHLPLSYSLSCSTLVNLVCYREVVNFYFCDYPVPLDQIPITPLLKSQSFQSGKNNRDSIGFFF